MTEQCEKVRRVAITNNQRNICIYTIVITYLKKAAADYYEKIKDAVIQQVEENVTANLKNLLIAYFTSDSIKDV